MGNLYEDIKQQFDEQLGIEPSNAVIQNCVELCLTYNIDDAVEFVEQWLAFSISYLHGEEPSLDYLQDFERKVFQAKRDKELAASAAKKKSKYSSSMGNRAILNVSTAAAAVENNPLAIYGVEDCMTDMGNNDGGVGDGITSNDDVLDAYNVCHTPKAKNSLTARMRTPARPGVGDGGVLFSPASYSPMLSGGTPRSRMVAQGSGKIVYTFGNRKLIAAGQWASLQPKKVQVKQLPMYNSGNGSGSNDTSSSLYAANKGKYMFDNLREKCEIASDRLFHVGKSLCRKEFDANAEDYDLSQVDVHSQDVVKTVGTICCDHDGPLDASSTLLVGSDEMLCRSVRLNFSKAKSVGVFPGQVVMLSGMNPKGDVFMVDEVMAERDLPPPSPPKIADELSFVIAAGPYTHDDDLIYDPLHDLMSYVKANRPDCLILTGPFLDAEHKLIRDNVTLAETFDSFFEKMIAGIVEVVGPSTTILLVTSHRDAHADPVYPTPPMPLKRSYPNVHVLTDPTMIDLNGIVIGLTSTDVVRHIVTHELAINAGDKVKRVVNYLLHQGSFYPLNPPPEEVKMCYDSNLASKHASIEQIPNILILPSEEKYFIRVVSGCLAINPGLLTDSAGGTFARLIVSPPAPKEEDNILNYTACQVRKV